mmetsp:Transcript_40429/g.61668  ORF Transcript_40429/g.61668 Transcript_40429/m.61668 type:complete len:207 (+) Transcript_40429:1948-2568(+)
MTFVNQVAEITHSMVDRYGGATNKNIGQAFLMVWKFPNPQQLVEMARNDDFKMVSRENSRVADSSVYTVIKIISKINRFEHIVKYNGYPAISKMIGQEFKVRMGFGLHHGWAIEGAIGSQFKIDASYLSPNVNMASRLEYATKQFGTEILISGAMYDILSRKFKGICREIDRVTVKGSNVPISLFTIDIDIKGLDRTIDPLFKKST